MHKQGTLNVLRITAFILAGIVLFLGLFARVSLLISAANVQNTLLPLQLMGGSAIANLITPLVIRIRPIRRMSDGGRAVGAQ
jgi:hypothetical protein